MTKVKKQEPWDRIKGETGQAHDAFLVYRDLGSSRRLRLVNQGRAKGVPEISQVKEWSARFDWVERCRLWDTKIQNQRDRELAKDAARYERRRLDEVERVFQLGQTYANLVDQALKFPLAKRTIEQVKDENGNVVSVTTIEPARWTLRDIAVIGELSVRLIAASLAAVDKDPAAMSDRELEAVLTEGYRINPETG